MREAAATEYPASNDLLHLLVQTLADEAIFVLGPAGTIASWSLAAERLYGVTAAAAIGQPLATLWPAASAGTAPAAAMLQRAQANGHDTATLAHPGAGGAVAWTCVTVTRLGTIGQPTRGYGVVARAATAPTAAADAGVSLAASEREYRELVENANSIILRWNARGQITLLNEFGLRFFGYRLDEIIGQSVMGTIVPQVESSGRDLGHLIASICADPAAFEQNVNENMRRTGERVWIAWTNRIVRNAAGDLVEILSIGTDITARRQAEIALREAELRFHTLFEQTPVGVAVVDPATSAFIECNEQAARQLGYTRQELCRLTIADITADTSPAAAQRREARLQALGQSEFETRHRTKSGALREVLVSERRIALAGHPVIHSVLLDITERKRAEAALHLRDRAIQAVSQGILITDCTQPDNPIIFVSAGFERMTGYAAAEVLGHNCRLLQGKDTDPDTIAELRAAIAAGRACSVEILNYRKDGQPFWNQLTIAPICSPDGELTHFVGVQTDVTERRRLEAHFRQAQKMEAVGKLAAGIAHDFNNLLTVINGYCDLLLNDGTTPAAVRETLLQVLLSGQRAGGLTRQLLAFSRQQVLEPRVLDLNAVVAGTEKLLRRMIGEDVELVLQLAPRLGQVKADPCQLEQVLMNLAVNARDAMPGGGRFTIATHAVSLDEAACRALTDLAPGPYILLQVSDTGCGMDEVTMARIFEPFFTTKEPGKGTGLGLATVQGIVKQSRGQVAVVSELGRGTTFRVYLPQVAGAAAVAAATPPAVAAMPRGSETILLVEDHASVRGLASKILRVCGYQVLAAANGHEALQLCQPPAGPIHLLVSDVVMPQLGGRALAERILALHPRCRVLYISGYADDAVLRHGVQAADFAFLQKPFTPSSLAQKVRAVLDA